MTVVSAICAVKRAPFALNPEPEPRPANYAISVSFGSSHPGVVQVDMVDGSVQSLSRDIDPTVLDRMCQINDGDTYDINGTLPSCTAAAPPSPF